MQYRLFGYGDFDQNGFGLVTKCGLEKVNEDPILKNLDIWNVKLINYELTRISLGGFFFMKNPSTKHE